MREPHRAPVENGAPVQGTWARAFDEIDLLSIRKPYSFPLPRGLKEMRIKEWESFIVQDSRFIFQAQLCNLKFYRIACLVMYDKETKERVEFRKALPGGAWRLPRGLYNASVESRSYRFFFRIHAWLDAGNITIELNAEQARRGPPFTARITFDLAAGRAEPVAVSLLFSETRSMCAFKTLAGVWGDVVCGGRHIRLNPAVTSGLFCDFKGYYPYRMRSAWAAGFGFDSRGRRFGFALGENQAREPFSNNENALWVDGRLTPLPPVRITRNGGPDSDWIIQDMEGMVDLVFTPVVPGAIARRLVLFTAEYENPMGHFNGSVVNAEGEALPVRNVWGSCEKVYLRV
jgi:hypothetical protein